MKPSIAFCGLLALGLALGSVRPASRQHAAPVAAPSSSALHDPSAPTAAGAAGAGAVAGAWREGAVRAASFGELAALLGDPAGPPRITLASGVHRGNLQIRRPVALRGEPGAVIEGSGADSVVSVEASDVSVEDLVVRHSGRRHSAEDAGIRAQGERVKIARVRVEDALFGVRLAQCKDCQLEGLHVLGSDGDEELRGDGIKLWESHGSSVRDSLIERSRDLVVWYTRRATLERVTVRQSRYGAHFMYAHDAVVRDSHFERNVVGVFVMYSARVRLERSVLAGARGAAGIGIGFKDSDAVDVAGNWIVANTVGAYLDNTPRTEVDPVTVSKNVLALNDLALSFHGAERGLHVVDNDFRDNAAQIDVEGGGDALSTDFRGNHYSDYEGYDLDHDGLGDVPYEVKALASGMAAERPAMRFFHGTAAMGLVEAVARAVPMIGSRKLLTDPAPRFMSQGWREP